MSNAQTSAGKIGGYRWVICGLLFFATTVNYLDRMVLGVLKPVLEKDMGWNQIDYGNIVMAFQFAYAVGLLVMGRVVDRIGVRRGFALATILWGSASALHGLVAYMDPTWKITVGEHSVLGILLGTPVLPMSVLAFMGARLYLGVAEAGNFPACIKAVGLWFPKKERAFATGIFNSGANIGAMVAPVLVPWIATHLGWGWSFYSTAMLDLVFVVMWLWIYRSPEEHAKLTPAELAYIRSDPADPPQKKMPWLALLGHRQTWAFTLGKFLTDPIWWLYLFWIPDFLNKQHGLNIKQFGPPLIVIYTMTCFGSVGGGWLSSKLIHSGWTVNASRKTAMLICALCVVPIIVATQVSNLWVAVLLIGLAASAHAGWSANIFTLVSDTVPKQAISSVTGIGGMGGAVGGILIARIVPDILERTHNNYFIPFAMAAVAYLLALLVIHLILPTLEPMKLKTEDAAKS